MSETLRELFGTPEELKPTALVPVPAIPAAIIASPPRPKLNLREKMRLIQAERKNGHRPT